MLAVIGEIDRMVAWSEIVTKSCNAGTDESCSTGTDSVKEIREVNIDVSQECVFELSIKRRLQSGKSWTAPPMDCRA